MEHLTDQKISELWIEPGIDEQTFGSIISHLHQCKVCRERAYQWLKSQHEIRVGVHNFVESIFKHVKVAAVEVVSGEDVRQMAIMTALKRLTEQPDKVEWDSSDLFDEEMFDDLEHVVQCQACKRHLDTMIKVVESIAKKALDDGQEDLTRAALKLTKWLMITRSRIQEYADARGVSHGNEAGGDTPCSFSA